LCFGEERLVAAGDVVGGDGRERATTRPGCGYRRLKPGCGRRSSVPTWDRARPGEEASGAKKGEHGSDATVVVLGGEQELRDRVATALGPDYQAFTQTALAAERARNATPTESGNTQIFLAASVVASFAGMFLIRNTFTIILASRARELALLRCVGASHAQLRRSVLLESSIVGTLASLVGLVVGIGLASGLGALLRRWPDAWPACPSWPWWPPSRTPAPPLPARTAP
jgi:hypothetical protein